MKIPVLVQPLIDAVSRPSPSLVEQLRVGQTLQAKVLEQVQPGLLRLQLASTVLLARSQVALDSGTRLSLEVTKPYPLPELKILRPLNPRELRDQVIRTALPRQLPPAEVRLGLSTLRETASTQKPLGDNHPLNRLARIAAGSGMRLDRLSATAVKRAVADSGLFHEARLAAGNGVAAGDNKLKLLQLLGLLRGQQAGGPAATAERRGDPDQGSGTPRTAIGDALVARLLRLVEGTLARLQLQQASALPQEDPQRQAWQLDLPLHLGDETQDAVLRIAREANASGQESDATWAVTLSFGFETIGRLQCRIALSGERLSTTFWCEHDATLAAIDARLPSLQQAFEAQGFEVVHLAGLVGEPDEPIGTLPVAEGLLDERA